MGKKRRKVRRRAADEGLYICPSCGEEIVVPLDVSEGREQRYVEDCPVCCNPNVIHVEFFEEGELPRVWAERE
jgi:transcription elongation factor Elf1